LELKDNAVFLTLWKTGFGKGSGTDVTDYVHNNNNNNNNNKYGMTAYW
jgi:hypothetical protein